MNQITRSGWSAYGLAGLVIVFDQAVKAWILGLGLRLYESRPVAGVLQFTLVPNKGVSFGFLRADQDLARWGLVVFSLMVAAMIVWWARRAHRPLQALGYGLIVGGAVGNAIDRARFGWVVDFIDVQRIGFFPWVFNVADSAITVGVIALLLDSLRREPAAS
ncbi:signal peptidase II [Phenylobacterium sp.]|uniref:signal peptidase II n=1 Tax=Phenylobacterium sp. TaxID=1871053 RepID=UPI002DF57E49|nr:signal peptidase II [Phenylobacterium sp.]